jgi:hypothetical protein
MIESHRDVQSIIDCQYTDSVIKIDLDRKPCEYWENKDLGIMGEEYFTEYTRTFKEMVQGASNVIPYLVSAFSKKIESSFVTNDPYQNLVTKKSHSIALIVLFHGLNGDPSVYDGHKRQFERVMGIFQNFSMQLYVPTVPGRGHIELLKDEQIKEIFATIAAWGNNHPGVPIIFFGQSRGGTVGIAAELFLRKHAPSNPVLFIGTGAAMYGSQIISTARSLFSDDDIDTLTKGMVSKTICTELSFGCEPLQELLRKARERLEEHVAKRTYKWYGSTFDNHLGHTGAALPILNVNDPHKSEEHFLVTNYGHDSIVGFDVPLLVHECVKFILENNKNVDKSLYGIAQGIYYYKNNEKGVVQLLDDRSNQERTGNSGHAVYDTVCSGVGKIWLRVTENGQNFPTAQKIDGTYAFELPHWKANSSGMYVFIHTRKGHPTDWNLFVNEIEQHDPNADIFVPYVPEEGNCSLDRAGRPFLPVIRDYLQNGKQGAPVYIIGAANGGRIACNYIEPGLDPKDLNDRSLRFASIAGVHNGVSLLNQGAGFTGILGYNNDFVEELQSGSTLATQFHRDWKEKQSAWKDKNVCHLFVASLNDIFVDVEGALPYDKNSNSNYVLVPGASHAGLVNHVCKLVLWNMNPQVYSKPEMRDYILLR